MMLFIDTETTGKIEFKLPLTHPSQPRLVQLAAYLAEDSPDTGERCRHVASINEIVRPDGWTIPAEAERVHGISTERARSLGLPLDEVMARLAALVSRADASMLDGRFIAHNVAFDMRVLLSEYARIGREDLAMNLNSLRPFCTMQSLTARMRLPSKWGGRNSYKWPTLDEAYRFCFAREIVDRETHSAMVDLMACRDIFNHGREQEWWR
jgi:DNA polymerase-3 subunit epsilon